MKFILTRDVIKPSIGTDFSAGIDFYIPKFSKEFIQDFYSKNNPDNSIMDNEKIIIHPHGRVLIPTGVKYFIERNRMLVAMNKSGVSTKKGLVYGAQLCDEDYEGEMHISLINTTNENVELFADEKIIQFVEMEHKSFTEEITEKEWRELHDNRNNLSSIVRSNGGFGSTNN